MASSLPPPGATSSPRGTRPRRPWYLNLALVVAWLMGAFAVLGGSQTLHYLHIAPDEFSLEVDRQPDLTPAERAREKDTFEAYAAALHVAKNRVVPLSVAELVVGIAMVLFAHGATAGSAWARRVLIQLTVAHLALSGLEWSLTPDIRASETDFGLAASNIERKQVSDQAIGLAGLGMSVAINALTVLGLTLRRSRAFYDGAPPISDP